MQSTSSHLQPCRLSERPLAEFVKLYPGHFIVEPKHDGERVLVKVSYENNDFKVEITNRYGTTYNLSFLPDYQLDILRAVACLKTDLVLDCEFVSTRNADLYTFLKDRVQELENTQLMVFDILMNGSEDLRAKPLIARKKLLSEILGNIRVRTVHFEIATIPDQVWKFYNRMTLKAASKFEGIVVKPVNSIYTDGAWLKIKKTVTHDVVILAIKKTATWTREGVARSFRIGFLDEEGRKVYYGDVSSGWSRVETRLQPTGEEDDEYVYVKPDVVVEIMAHSLLASKKFREPRILKERYDKRPQDCKIPDGH